MDGPVTNGDFTHSVFSNDFTVKGKFSKVGLKPLKSWCNFLEACGGHKTRSRLFCGSPSLVLVLRSNQTCLTLLQSIVSSLVWRIVFTCERLSHISLFERLFKILSSSFSVWQALPLRALQGRAVPLIIINTRSDPESCPVASYFSMKIPL